MNILKRSFEQIAVTLTLAILTLTSLNFALSSQLQEQHENRFIFSAVILALSTLYLRFGINQISALHQAGYRIAVVMMTWAVGLYFFPYPNTVLYLIIIPGFYFLYRIEIKKEQAIRADKTAAGLLFLLAVFLYIQQQPLQAILFEGNPFNWSIYYQNAPGILLVGLALIRFQKWLHWDGIATVGTLIVIIAGTLSATLINNEALPLNELFFLALISHLLLAFIFIPNPIFQRFIDFIGIQHQNLNYPKSIYVITFTLTQFSLFFLLESYWQGSFFSYNGIPLLKNLSFINVNNIGLLATFLLTITLPVYFYRRWSISLVLFEAALIIAFLVLSGSLAHLGSYNTIVALVIVAAILLSMLILKRNNNTSEWINNWSFIGVLICYGLVFFQTNMFTPLGLIGFIFPMFSWGLLPDRPASTIRRYEAYFWPLLSIIIISCLSSQISLEILTNWALLTIAAPLILTLSMSNTQFLELIQTRGWKVLHLWALNKDKYLIFYSLTTLFICLFNFLNNQFLFEDSWFIVNQTIVTLLLCASAILYVSIKNKRIQLMLVTELILWLTMALVRWKLESLKLLQLGTPIDGYIFISIAVVVAGIKEKLRDNSPHLKSHFIKSSIIYSLIGWLYLLYLNFTGVQSLHGELSSIIMAGLFYWLSRSTHQSMKVLVFIFANTSLFLFFIDNNITNLVVYLTPSIASALLLTQMFKEDLSDFQVRQIRLFCGLILLTVSAGYNILDFQSSVWYPASAAIISAIVVLLGISLQIRIFLYLGSSFIFINIIGMIANIIIHQPPEKTMFAVGILFLVTGILFIASYLLFQMKREEIRQKYLAISNTIAQWE
ncbi:hypothetical protein [Aliikangiella sp. IMCC44359]|uniref:hypothetical protein n=1 Tax=Aliikangiella sp. IMCC44359 TaxID=3459125 RepID=UPI00403AA7CD